MYVSRNVAICSMQKRRDDYFSGMFGLSNRLNLFFFMFLPARASEAKVTPGRLSKLLARSTKGGHAPTGDRIADFVCEP